MTDTATEALLPCPFCGATDTEVRDLEDASTPDVCRVHDSQAIRGQLARYCMEYDRMTSRHPAVSCACPKCQSERRTTPPHTPATDTLETYGTMTPTIEVVPPHYPLATDEREAVARAMLEWGTPWDSVETGILADAALSALAPYRAAEILAAEANERARWADWARVRSALNHRWAAEGEHLRTERIALSSAYAELADAIERGEHGAGK